MRWRVQQSLTRRPQRFDLRITLGELGSEVVDVVKQFIAATTSSDRSLHRPTGSVVVVTE
jgi:hypothetical protein